MKKTYCLQVTRSSSLQILAFKTRDWIQQTKFFVRNARITEERTKLRRFSKNVLRCLLLTIGNQVKFIFLNNIQKSLFLLCNNSWSNWHFKYANLVRFTYCYDHRKEEPLFTFRRSFCSFAWGYFEK